MKFYKKAPQGVVFKLDLSLPAAVVPCGGCRLCCQKTPVMLVPEAGDDVKSYDTVVGPDGRSYLRMRDSGDCIYLNDSGCTIHDRVPYACRVFDCRAQYLRRTRDERRAEIKAGMLDKRIMKRAKELLK